MTLAAPENSEPEGAALVEGAALGDDVAVRPVVRQRSVQKRRKRRTAVIAQGAATVVFSIALVVLALAGWSAALRITGGDAYEVTDPAAPGYIAAVKPTNVTLIAFTAENASAPPTSDAAAPTLATMLLVIGRSGDPGHTLVPIPAITTLWDFEGSGPDSAAGIFASGGIDVLKLRLGADLGFGTTEALSAPVSMIGQMAAAAGPLTIALPDDVLQGTTEADASVKYAAGQLILEPGQVVEFMSFLGFGESESNRALRLRLAWEALAAATAGSGTGSSLPDGDGGPADDAQAAVAEVLAGAATPDSRFDVVPMLAVPLNVSPPVTLHRIDQLAMPAWTMAQVPFPISAFPGQRARVELLNGTTDAAALQSVASKVVGANGEIAVTGNAENLGTATSRVEYSAEEARTAAERIATALGLSAVRNPDAAPGVDVVVVVGTDQLSQG